MYDYFAKLTDLASILENIFKNYVKIDEKIEKNQTIFLLKKYNKLDKTEDSIFSGKSDNEIVESENYRKYEKRREIYSLKDLIELYEIVGGTVCLLPERRGSSDIPDSPDSPDSPDNDEEEEVRSLSQLRRVIHRSMDSKPNDPNNPNNPNNPSKHMFSDVLMKHACFGNPSNPNNPNNPCDYPQDNNLYHNNLCDYPYNNPNNPYANPNNLCDNPRFCLYPFASP